MTIASFRRVVWAHYKKNGRHELPWRKTTDPYKILVSEVMLQQTQVDRVVSFYTSFIKRFPTARSLASAPLSKVLKAWQGLGYNRRAKMLHAAAKQLSDIHVLAYRSKHERLQTGMFNRPKTVADLEQLPGVGPYTARAVAAFAWNDPVVMIETNIRTAVIHHFFPRREKVGDAEIESVLARALPKDRVREWYWALMDYGAHLKRSGISHNARTKGYVKQSRFAGSARQARGAILKELARGSISEPRLLGLLGDDRRPQLRAALLALLTEGFVAKRGRAYALAQN